MSHIIKRLDESHRGKTLEHFLRLDPDSIYSRFCAPLKEDSLERYVSKLNFERNGIYGVFDEQLNIVGIGECVLDKEKDQAEVGFSVEKQYQGNGLGNKLMQKIVRYAKAHNIHHLEMVCLRTNAVSMHLAKKHGLHVKENYGGESYAVIDMEHINPEIENFSDKMEDSMAYYALKQREQINNWNEGQKLINDSVNNMYAGMIKLMTPKLF